MANLIIKSAAGNDLVIQGGDNSPAITVGNTGLTTFAENATLSGTANNLGTISSATTFPAGHVLQVVMGGIETGSLGMTSSNFANTGLDAAITPSSTSNKVLILTMNTWDTSASERAIEYALYRDSSIIFDNIGYSYGGDGRTIGTFNATYLHSPSTTSSTTYQLYARAVSSATVYVRYGDTNASMVLMEIKG